LAAIIGLLAVQKIRQISRFPTDAITLNLPLLNHNKNIKNDSG